MYLREYNLYHKNSEEMKYMYFKVQSIRRLCLMWYILYSGNAQMHAKGVQ